jgi:hypothetical protein
MQPLFIAASQLLGKDAVRGKVITDAEKRRITIEVRPAQSSASGRPTLILVLMFHVQVLRAKSSGLL